MFFHIPFKPIITKYSPDVCLVADAFVSCYRVMEWTCEQSILCWNKQFCCTLFENNRVILEYRIKSSFFETCRILEHALPHHRQIFRIALHSASEILSTKLKHQDDIISIGIQFDRTLSLVSLQSNRRLD